MQVTALFSLFPQLFPKYVDGPDMPLRRVRVRSTESENVEAEVDSLSW